MNSSLQTRLLQAIASRHQVVVASESNIDKYAIHRITSGERGVKLEELEMFLSALGMAVIECENGETVTIPKAKYDALRTLAREGLE